MSTISRTVAIIVVLSMPFAAFGAVNAQRPDVSDRTLELIANAQRLVAVDADGCLKTNNAEEIVVCGSFDANRQYRLPLPELAIDPGKPLPRGEIPNGNPEIVQQGRCYVTMTERNCFKGVPFFITSLGAGKTRGAGTLWRIIPTYDANGDDVEQVQIKAAE